MSGSSAAGKTNLRYSLLGQGFVEEHDSTDIQETQHAYIANSAGVLETKEGKKIWKEFNLQEQLNQFKSLWEHRLNQKSEINSEHTIDGIPSDDLQTEDIPNDDSEIEDLSEVRTRINRSKGLSKQIKIKEPVKLISMIDTGGQPGYIHMLPAIIHMLPDSKNCPTVNLIVIDMTKNFKDKVLVRYGKKGQKDEVKPYHLHYTNEDLIKLLLSVTTDSFNVQRSTIAQKPNVNIGFVGTHKDVLQNVEKIHIFDYQLSELVEQQKCQNITIKPGSDYKYLYPVSNKTPNDTVVVELRDKIESLLDDASTMRIPINWMIVELAVKLYCDSKKIPYITYQEFQDIARKEASIKEEEEAKNALYYFHSRGILLNFHEVPKMSNYVIVKQQWLYDQLSMLVADSPENPSCGNGVLLKSELPKIKMEGSIKMEHLISLLDYKKILASYTIDNKVHYYLPFALPYCQKYHDKFKFLLLEPLLIRFSSGFLPRGFFCSLVVIFLQKMPDGWISSLHMNTIQQFRNVMTFLLPNDLFLRLQDKIHYLEIQVRHHQHCKPVESMLKELEILCKYVFNVCEILKLDCNKLQFGFLCQHGKWDEEEHMPEMLLKPSLCSLKYCRKCRNQTVLLPFMDEPSLFNLIYCEKCHNRIYCKKCHSITFMGELHKLWFKEEKVKIEVRAIAHNYTYVCH